MHCERGNKIIRGFDIVIIQVYCYQLCNHVVFIFKHALFRAVGFHILVSFLDFFLPLLLEDSTLLVMIPMKKIPQVFLLDLQYSSS